MTNQSKKNWDNSFKAGNMCMNRFTIDEDAAFELSYIYYGKYGTEYRFE